MHGTAVVLHVYACPLKCLAVSLDVLYDCRFSAVIVLARYALSSYIQHSVALTLQSPVHAWRIQPVSTRVRLRWRMIRHNV